MVLDILVQGRRDGAAAKRFLKGLHYTSRVLVTDKLKSYGVAKRVLFPSVEHRENRYLNNRAENSHRPTRRRERQLQRFKSMRQAQRFLSAHAFISGHFRLRRHRMAVSRYRAMRAKAFTTWTQETCARNVGMTAPIHLRSAIDEAQPVNLTMPVVMLNCMIVATGRAPFDW